MTFNKFVEKLTRARARARLLARTAAGRVEASVARHGCRFSLPPRPFPYELDSQIKSAGHVDAFDKAPADKTDKLIRRGKPVLFFFRARRFARRAN